MLCHSVRSCHSPALSLYRSLVARLNLATGTPLGVYLTSGSLPRFPTRITLFTLFAMRDHLISGTFCPNIPVEPEILKWERAIASWITHDLPSSKPIVSRPPGFPWLQAHDQRYLLFGSFIAENHPGPIQEAGINTSLKLGLRNLFVFVWASFLLVTSLYCLLAFLPYTFYALIKAPAYDWMPWLVRNYAYLYWITLAGLTWACWPERKGRGFTLLFSVLLLLGVFVTVHPVLASVQSNVAAYAWAAGSLLPIIAFAVLHA